MNETSIFSTYSTPENRATASILAVLRNLAIHRVEHLLGALLQQSEFELVRFQNQVRHSGRGIPDAEISSSCRILLETKREPNHLGPKQRHQLEGHLLRFDESGDSKERMQILLVLTPDDRQPPLIDELRDKRVVWASFADLD